MKRLENKIALITGAARGIGAATAKLFADEGARVIVTDILDDEGQAVADSLGNGSQYYHLDVAKESDWVEVMKKLDRLDVLFNNAGVIGVKGQVGVQDPENLTLSDWHEIHQVNLDGAFLGCKHGIGLMKKHGGSIINMSSRSGVVGIPTAVAYASSKAAIRNHTKSVALYCAQMHYNIRCNSLHPGAILTPMWNDMLGDDEATQKAAIAQIAEGIPLGHMGDPMDAAYSALYLACDESKYVTGIELTLDGGILCGATASPKKKD